MNFNKLTLSFIIVMSIFVGCSVEPCDCTAKKEDVKEKYGNPEEVNTYTSDGYNSDSWWYWSKGISYTFTWGSIVDGCCDMSVYTFSPITNLSPDNKNKAKKEAVIIYNYIDTEHPLNSPAGHE